MTGLGLLVGDRKTWVRDIVFTAATSLAFAFLAPSGESGMPLQQRVVENFALGFASFAVLWPPMRVALRLGAQAGLPELFVVVAGLAVLTLPVALISRIIVPRLQGLPGPPPPLMSTYFIVLSLTLPVGAAYLMVERRLLTPRPTGTPAQETRSAPTLKLVNRLPLRLGGQVLAVQAEDHYVRVHTALGSELLLMRMGDAITELVGLEGERVHRSWWVARDAVKCVDTKGRKLSLTLTNGLEVPVTRDASAKLRREGWLRAI